MAPTRPGDTGSGALRLMPCATPCPLRSTSRHGTLWEDPTTQVVGLERFELSTSRLSSARSNQLSYRPGKRGGCPNEERETKAAASRIVGLWQAPCVLSARKEARLAPRASCFPASLERR